MYCRNCGNEIKTDIRTIPMYARDKSGVAILFIKYNHLCDECSKKFDEVQEQLECEEDFFN